MCRQIDKVISLVYVKKEERFARRSKKSGAISKGDEQQLKLLKNGGFQRNNVIMKLNSIEGFQYQFGLTWLLIISLRFKHLVYFVISLLDQGQLNLLYQNSFVILFQYEGYDFLLKFQIFKHYIFQRIFEFIILEMEKVPQIRLFGTGQSFRKNNSPAYAKEYTFSSNYNTFNSNTQTSFSSSNNALKLQRSQSMNRLNSVKPFQTNYYQNAIKICQQNRVLNKNIHVQSYGFLKGNYLTYHNHKTSHSNCNKCTHCDKVPTKGEKKDRIISKNLKTVVQEGKTQVGPLKFQQNYQSHQLTPQLKNTLNTDRFSVTDYINDQQNTPITINNISIKHINSTKMVQDNKKDSTLKSMVKKSVGFNQITNSLNYEKNFESNNFTIDQGIKTERSETLDNISNQMRNNLNQYSNTLKSHLTNTSKQSKNYSSGSPQQISRKIQTILFDLNSQNQSNDRQYMRNRNMIQELQEISKENLQLKKEFIHKLDQILEHERVKDYEKVKQGQIRDKQIKQKERLRLHLMSTQKLNEKKNEILEQNSAIREQSMNSNKKRKKLFVTQSEYLSTLCHNAWC